MAGLILFPSSLLDHREIDEAFAGEWNAAQDAGFEVALLDAMALEERAFDRAVRRVPVYDRPAIYRGWMLTADVYEALHAALLRRGVGMLTDPAAYRYAHHLPESYPDIQQFTARTVWTTAGAAFDQNEITAKLAIFGNAPIVVKDYVKSQKHYWHEACYIPDAGDTAMVQRIAMRFAELQAESFAGGFVFREFVDLEPLATHAKSGMPLTKEFRLFFLDGKLLATAPYWESGDYAAVVPPLDFFAQIAARILSRFFTMDIAQKRNSNEWMILEIGDGQVSGIPERLPLQSFYRALGS